MVNLCTPPSSLAPQSRRGLPYLSVAPPVWGGLAWIGPRRSWGETNREVGVDVDDAFFDLSAEEQKKKLSEDLDKAFKDLK